MYCLYDILITKNKQHSRQVRYLGVHLAGYVRKYLERCVLRQRIACSAVYMSSQGKAVRAKQSGQSSQGKAVRAKQSGQSRCVGALHLLNSRVFRVCKLGLRHFFRALKFFITSPTGGLVDRPIWMSLTVTSCPGTTHKDGQKVRLGQHYCQ
jgi:hypothetical protein